VHDQIAGDNPTADGAGVDVETFRDLGDREESNLIVGVTTTMGNRGGPHNSPRAFRPVVMSVRPDEVFDGCTACRERVTDWAGAVTSLISDIAEPNALGGTIAGSRSTQERKSSARINVRRPRFTARNSPDLITAKSAVRPVHVIAHAWAIVYANGSMLIRLLEAGLIRRTRPHLRGQWRNEYGKDVDSEICKCGKCGKSGKCRGLRYLRRPAALRIVSSDTASLSFSLTRLQSFLLESVAASGSASITRRARSN
jgi:hypothetical protein